MSPWNDVRNLGGDFDAAIKVALAFAAASKETLRFWFDRYDHAYLTAVVTPEGADGASTVSPEDTYERARGRYLELHYNGEEGLPKWWAAGVQLKVKSTPETRRSGVRTRRGVSGADDRAHVGEVGTVVRHEGNGWWCWLVEFARGRTVRPEPEVLAKLARVKP